MLEMAQLLTQRRPHGEPLSEPASVLNPGYFLTEHNYNNSTAYFFRRTELPFARGSRDRLSCERLS